MSRSSLYHLNFELKSTSRGKLVGEDLSPILKKNSGESNLSKYGNLSHQTDSAETEDLITQLNTVKIHNDDYQIVHSEARIMNDINMWVDTKFLASEFIFVFWIDSNSNCRNAVREKMNAGKLSKKTKRKPQKENVLIINRVESGNCDLWFLIHNLIHQIHLCIGTQWYHYQGLNYDFYQVAVM